MERIGISTYFLTGLAAIALASILFIRTADAAITADLQIGSTGEDVTELQTYLASDAALYPEGLITGYYGSLTSAAVVRFQARHGIAQVGRVGPITRAKLNELLGGGAGGGVAGDVFAPTMTIETVSTTSASATISWSTSEPARHRVMYATAWPFLFATAQSTIDATVDTGASVTLTGLAASTTYFYVRESIDANGNVMWTDKKTFSTQ